MTKQSILGFAIMLGSIWGGAFILDYVSFKHWAWLPTLTTAGAIFSAGGVLVLLDCFKK